MRFFISLLLVTYLGFAGAFAGKPNVVFIIVDDLNDMPLQPDGKPLVPTPNIDRLKAQGVTFTNAHTNDPLCAPSRASMHFGLYPQTTSLYWFEDWRDNGILKESVSLIENLADGGYSLYGTGKIYHGDQTGLFENYGYGGNIGPWPWDGRKETKRGFLPHPQQLYFYEGEDADMDYKWEHVFGPISAVPDWPADESNGIPGYKGWVSSGKPWKYVNDQDRDPMPDELGTAWTSAVFSQKHEKPFALFHGISKTHTPLYAPQEYFDRFPLDSIVLPTVDPNDLDDVSPALGNETLYGFRRYKMLFRHEDKELFRKWLQAYMACVSFVDDQVGDILDALEASPFRDNTVVFFTSDHGFHVGEKNFLYKGSLWEPSTRVPLIIAGVDGSAKGETCEHPVSLIDIYPTFNDLFGLNEDPNADGNGYDLEGYSLAPLIMNPENGEWSGPDVAISTIPGKNHMHHRIYEGTLYPHFSVRGKRWRYSLTSNGGEELYDHEKDPYEWRNLAHNPEYAFVKAGLKTQLTELREGRNWTELDDMRRWTAAKGVKVHGGEIRMIGSGSAMLSTKDSFENFEFEADLKVEPKTRMKIRYRKDPSSVVYSPILASNEAEYSRFHVGEWNRYRIRVHAGRHQLWINNRFVSDEVRDATTESGPLVIEAMGLRASDVRIRKARIRKL